MFGIGTTEFILILIIVLIFLGPKKLPQIAKALGKGISEFKRASNEIRENLSNIDVEEEEKGKIPPPEKNRDENKKV